MCSNKNFSSSFLFNQSKVKGNIPYDGTLSLICRCTNIQWKNENLLDLLQNPMSKIYL